MPGQGRLGDRAAANVDAHGCPACPHPTLGPAIAGSPDVVVNGRPALRVDDVGIHAACCGPNMWSAVKGSATVFINGKPAHRMNDMTRHCGGAGQLIEGSSDVIVGDSSAGGGGGGGGGGGAAADDGGTGGGSGGGTGGETGTGTGTGADDLADLLTPPALPAEPPAAKPIEPDAIEVLVVNVRSQAQARTAYELELPDGSRHTGLTGEDGRLRHDGIAQPGSAHLLLVDAEQAEQVETEGAPPRTPGAIRYAPGGVAVDVGRSSTVEIPPRVFRARLTGLLFETDKTFLLPKAIPGVRMLKRFYEQHPGETLISGHADTAGAADYNLRLSRDRSQAMADYLVDHGDGWLAWYDEPTASKRFGVREDQHMLATILDGNGTPFYTDTVDGQAGTNTRDATARFQASRGLAATGTMNRATRSALIAAYMDLDGTSFPADEVMVQHGCGESHPAVATGDNVSAEPNRRVEIFFFEDQIDPPPVEPCPAPGCAEYPEWVRRTILTVDLDVPPGHLTVTVIDRDAQPIAGADVHVSGPLPDGDPTGADGTVTFRDLIPATYRVIAQKGDASADATVVVPSDAEAAVTLVLDPTTDYVLARVTGLCTLNKSFPKPAGLPLLREVARRMAEDSSLHAIIIGHTDAGGPDDVSLELSRSRAAAVAALLTGDAGFFRGRFATADPIRPWDFEEVQWMLSALRIDGDPFYVGMADGHYGDVTRAALQAFQSAHELEVTHECGEATLTALIDDYQGAIGDARPDAARVHVVAGGSWHPPRAAGPDGQPLTGLEFDGEAEVGFRRVEVFLGKPPLLPPPSACPPARHADCAAYRRWCEGVVEELPAPDVFTTPVRLLDGLGMPLAGVPATLFECTAEGETQVASLTTSKYGLITLTAPPGHFAVAFGLHGQTIRAGFRVHPDDVAGVNVRLALVGAEAAEEGA